MDLDGYRIDTCVNVYINFQTDSFYLLVLTINSTHSFSFSFSFPILLHSFMHRTNGIIWKADKMAYKRLWNVFGIHQQFGIQSAFLWFWCCCCCCWLKYFYITSIWLPCNHRIHSYAHIQHKWPFSRTKSSINKNKCTTMYGEWVSEIPLKSC